MHFWSGNRRRSLRRTDGRMREGEWEREREREGERKRERERRERDFQKCFPQSSAAAEILFFLNSILLLSFFLARLHHRIASNDMCVLRAKIYLLCTVWDCLRSSQVAFAQSICVMFAHFHRFWKWEPTRNFVAPKFPWANKSFTRLAREWKNRHPRGLSIAHSAENALCTRGRFTTNRTVDKRDLTAYSPFGCGTRR